MIMSLNLPASPRTLCFQALADTIRKDPVIRSVVAEKSLLFVDGDPRDRAELVIGQAPAMRFTIATGADEWWQPESFKGPLSVNVEMLVKGACQLDVQNLWWALVRAFYPKDQDAKFAIQKRLKAAGAETGQVRFTQPAYAPQQLPEDGGFRAMGQMQLMIRLPLNT